MHHFSFLTRLVFFAAAAIRPNVTSMLWWLQLANVGQLEYSLALYVTPAAACDTFQ